MNESNMERTLKNVAKLIGFLLLAISVYLSYDGFDQGVTGGNTGYSQLAKMIGLVLAIAISTIQFIMSSRYDQLNSTLKLTGLASYAYSIYTNYLGAKHLLGMDESAAWVTAFAMDIVPEPMIAWSLGDATKGDFVGNLAKWVSGHQPKPQQPQQQQPQSGKQNGKGEMGKPVIELLREAHGQDRHKMPEKVGFGDNGHSVKFRDIRGSNGEKREKFRG